MPDSVSPQDILLGDPKTFYYEALTHMELDTLNTADKTYLYVFAHVQVEIEGPSVPQISVFDRDDGTYLVTWNVEATGQYIMRIILHGLQIASSPFTPIVMPGRVVAVRCTGTSAVRMPSVRPHTPAA
jgi:hypothetical protein